MMFRDDGFEKGLGSEHDIFTMAFQGQGWQDVRGFKESL